MNEAGQTDNKKIKSGGLKEVFVNDGKTRNVKIKNKLKTERYEI